MCQRCGGGAEKVPMATAGGINGVPEMLVVAPRVAEAVVGGFSS